MEREARQAGAAAPSSAPITASGPAPATSSASGAADAATAGAGSDRLTTDIMATGHSAGRRRRYKRVLGPAFVAAVAYVDPGNVAANLTAGARYGYLLLWVLVLASAIAVVVQLLSARIGAVTGHSLPELLDTRMNRPARLAFAAQAELVVIATDLAEVVGGAIALNLLFGWPLLLGGCVIGVLSLILLARGAHRFQHVVIALLVVVAGGFLSGLVVEPPSPSGMASGLLPRFAGADSVLVAASMLGATVMPHAIYAHSSLARDRGQDVASTRPDVVGALALAGVVNIGMLLLAAAALPGMSGTDTIAGAQAAIASNLGPVIGIAFAVALLASSLASTSVGALAGDVVLRGLLHVRWPLLVQRLITLIPSLVILAIGVEPTSALVMSQVVLSFGIPFALVPLAHLVSSRAVMGDYAARGPLRVFAWISVAIVLALNVALLALTLFA